MPPEDLQFFAASETTSRIYNAKLDVLLPTSCPTFSGLRSLRHLNANSTIALTTKPADLPFHYSCDLLGACYVTRLGSVTAFVAFVLGAACLMKQCSAEEGDEQDEAPAA